MPLIRRLLAASLGIALVSCNVFTGPDRVRVLGTIAGHQADDPRITIQPDGRTVEVRVSTYGGGCYSQGETDVAVEGLTATVTPYDYTASEGACTDILRTFEHRAVVQFPTSGTAVIRIRGLDTGARASTFAKADTLIVERSVQVH